MTSITTEEPISSGNRNLGPAHLEALAEGTDRVVVAAYDRESYLVWSKAEA